MSSFQLILLSLISTFFLHLSPLHAIHAKPKSLAERIDQAEKVFVGKLINKKTQGDWTTADLVVEIPLLHTEKDIEIAVIWRTTLGKAKMFDKAEGSKGVAILKHQRDGRYWLRADTFEDLEVLKRAREITGVPE